jgi:hypothetical protein
MLQNVGEETSCKDASLEEQDGLGISIRRDLNRNSL